jgi:glutamyl-tRNA synthetase
MTRTRFAPSPTGYLHIGGVRTALFNWLLARQKSGQFLLRIDDTDQQRNVETALQPILDGFRWLGLAWDEGPEIGGPHSPYFQSQRADRHAAAVQELLKRGAAYRDFASPEELEEQRNAAKKSDQTFVYDRQWAAFTAADADRFAKEGRTAVVRLKIPRTGQCVFQDMVRGEVRVDWVGEQDHVIQRADGSCLYHLASVVDDYDLQITHVVRASEHLANTPRQVFIAQALGYPLPVYAHVPVVAEPGGTAKLSKRKLEKYLKNKDFAELLDLGNRIAERMGHPITADTFNPVIVDFYRVIGFLPEAILNYLLLLGWSLDDKTERFTQEEMVRSFTLERITKNSASFDPKKLLAFQAAWMAELPLEAKTKMVLPFLQRTGLVADPADANAVAKVQQVVSGIGERLHIAGEILDYDYCFVQGTAIKYDPAAFSKRITQDAQARPLLKELVEQFAAVQDFSANVLHKVVEDFCAAQGIKMGQIIHALRVATTGQGVGFGMFETLEVLGQTETIARIRAVLCMS